jgi:hypothetical protein
MIGRFSPWPKGPLYGGATPPERGPDGGALEAPLVPLYMYFCYVRTLYNRGINILTNIYLF